MYVIISVFILYCRLKVCKAEGRPVSLPYWRYFVTVQILSRLQSYLSCHLPPYSSVERAILVILARKLLGEIGAF